MSITLECKSNIVFGFKFLEFCCSIIKKNEFADNNSEFFEATICVDNCIDVT